MKKNKIKRIMAASLCIIIALAFSACGSGDSNESDNNGSGKEKSEAALVITGYNDDKTEFSLEDIEEMGTETYIFSGRDKKAGNERQIQEFKGVPLAEVLEAAGYGKSGETMKVICSDGYSREYETEDLSGLYAFADEEDTEGTKVEPILAIEEKDGEKIIRLVYGQEDYDSPETKDFNMQGWASWIEKIEVGNE